MAKATCSVDGCTRPARTRGLCPTHYTRWLHHGHTATTRPLPAGERFWPKVTKDGPIPPERPDLGPCWLWTGGKGHAGYGQFRVKGSRQTKAHRFAYEDLVGPIPDGLHLDHLCRVPACVNPSHLEPVTPRENVQRGDKGRQRKTHCANGHPFDAANTYIAKNGWRQCRACQRDRWRRAQ